jgi:hypothetical protein
MPIAVDVRLAGADGAREHHVGIKTLAAHADGDIEGRPLRHAAEGLVQGAVDEAQPAVADLAQLNEQERARQTSQRRDALLDALRGVCWNDVRFHESLDAEGSDSERPSRGG